MGLQDFMSVFSNLDPSCKGFITSDQVLELYQSIYFSTISIDQIDQAILQVCGNTGHVSRNQFVPVLEELERRRSIEEQAYWDFQALDYRGSNRISLKDALMMFREFHGDKFCLHTWHQFLQSRDDPDDLIYFDEIRLWLCNYPSGVPATQEQIIHEEKQLEKKQSHHQNERLDKLRQIQDNPEDHQEYIDNQQYHTQRRKNKWDRQGLEAMLFDDGLEADEVTMTTKPKDSITMTDISDALSEKYDKLKSKLLWEMARMSAAIESDRQDIFQQLCREEKQYSREGSLSERVAGMSGSKLTLMTTLNGLIGEIKSHDTRRKEQATKTRETLQQQGMREADIDKAIQTEYQGFINGDTTCGATLVGLMERFKLEKEEMTTAIRAKATTSSVVMETEYFRLLRQHLLLTEEEGFPALAIAVGLAERLQNYKSISGKDWDRNRTEQLSKIRLGGKKGRKPCHTPSDMTDTNKLDDMGLTDLKHHLIREIVQKHFYEREAMIDMLQGRDSEQYKKKAVQMSSQERKKRLKILRNQHISWTQSNSDDTKHLHEILREGVALYSETRREELVKTANIVTDEVVLEAILADLIQRQEVEYEALLEQFVQKQIKPDIETMIKKENKLRIKEHFDNISFVALGTIEISPEDKDYIDALDAKYDAIRKNILRMGLEYEMGSEWKQLKEKEKKKHIKEKEKEERKFRGQGQLQEMERLIGPKSKALPSLRHFIGEEKAEYERRMDEQRKTGQIIVEPPAEKISSVNVLADLVPRYDNEQETMLAWLKSSSTKQLPVKTQRLKIVLLKLETFCSLLDEDFEVSALSVGLVERIIAALQNRHQRDQTRQYDLALRRTRLRQSRLQQKEEVKKKEISFTPDRGDLTGWQTAYLFEVMKRHDDERDQLLKYFQDESITELMEAAAEMSIDERKSRLAELQSKRRRLDLLNSGDREDYISLLEEAVAITAVNKKLGRTSMEEVTVTTLRDLQDKQDRELAQLLQDIDNMTETELESKIEEEKDNRLQGAVQNVFSILTETEDSVKEEEIIKVLEKKYLRLQDSLLGECLSQTCGLDSWNKMAEKDKLAKIDNLRTQVKDFIQKGDYVGLKTIVDVISLEKSVRAMMGSPRHQFLQRILGSDVIKEEEITDNINPFIEIQQRHEMEKDLLSQIVKGSSSLFLDDADQQIHFIRLKREIFIGSHFDYGFQKVVMVIGLAERQQTSLTPRLEDDRQRYEMVAMETLQKGTFSKRKEFKDEIVRGPTKIIMMEAVVILLDRSHQDEQQYLLLLLTSLGNPDIVMEIQSWSQQQRKDQLSNLHTQRLEMVTAVNKKDLDKIYREGVIIKREVYRHRLNIEQKEEVGEDVINKMLVADLLQEQNCHTERVLQSFKEEGQDFMKLQNQIIESKRNEIRENIAMILLTSETHDATSNEETELLEALDGKYDALRDKLLAEALLKQLGETEWNRLSELERQKKLAELKLKERKLRREGKFDEVANIIGAALEDQETLDRLFGESKEEQERKMRERLHRRKQRLAAGMSEQECDELEKEEIKQEEEEERQKRRNILLDLDNRCEKEKEELLRRLREQKDRVSLERQRQLELMKLKHDEKKARREEKFNSAALVIEKAKDQQKRLEQNQEDERHRQERLAKERLEAARRRRGQKSSPEPETKTDTEDKSSLQEAVGDLIDRRHRDERDLLIQLLDDATTDPNRERVAAMSEEDRRDNLEKLRQMRNHWRSSDDRKTQDQLELLKEAAVYILESKLHSMKTEGQEVTDADAKVKIVLDLEEKQSTQKTGKAKEATDENVKVQVLSDLQEKQDGEAKIYMSDLHEMDVRQLQQMVKLHKKTLDDGNHDNVSSVVLGDDDITVVGADDTAVTEDQIKNAVEQKYDILRGKLLEATLIMQVGQDEWSKLSDKEKQRRIIELKMKEKKLRQEGKTEEAIDLFEKLVENDDFGSEKEALENLFGDEEDEEQRARDREERKKELQRERIEKGLPVDDGEIEKQLDEEEKEAKRQKRRNVLENLQTMVEDEKAALMRQLKQQVSGIDQERQRQLALVKLKMDKKKMEREEKYDSAALVLRLAKEAEDKHKQNISADRERQKALAKERLEALRRKKQKKEENLEQKLKEENEKNKMLDAEESNDTNRIQAAILDIMDKTHTEERELLMELFNIAQQNKALSKLTSGMSQEELKAELSKLEQDHSKWKKKSQLAAMSLDDGTITQADEDKHLKTVANERKEQTKLLADALVYRLELEERNLKMNKPDLSAEKIREELNVTLLADLQDIQQRDNTTVQTIVQKQQNSDDLNKFKKMQRLANREGWFNNLTKTLFQVSHSEEEDTEDASTDDLERKRQEMEKQCKEEREEKIKEAMRAKMNGEDIDIQAELAQLEKEQQNKRKALDEELNKQKQALKDRINAKKRKGQEKEEDELFESYRVLMEQQNQAEKSKQVTQEEKTRQTSKLQEKIRLRKEERRRIQQEAGMNVSDEDTGSRPSTVDSKGPPPLFSLQREKTVVPVEISEDQKQAVLSKLVREHTRVSDNIKKQQEQQQEMLRRRLDKSRGRKEMQAKEIMDMSERQKKEYHKTKTEERDRQLSEMQKKISSRRARSKSPNTLGVSPVPEDQNE